MQERWPTRVLVDYTLGENFAETQYDDDDFPETQHDDDSFHQAQHEDDSNSQDDGDSESDMESQTSHASIAVNDTHTILNVPPSQPMTPSERISIEHYSLSQQYGLPREAQEAFIRFFNEQANQS